MSVAKSVNWVVEVVRFYAELDDTYEINSETISDLICDLIHLCESKGYDFDTLLLTAKKHSAFEKGEENGADAT